MGWPSLAVNGNMRANDAMLKFTRCADCFWNFCGINWCLTCFWHKNSWTICVILMSPEMMTKHEKLSERMHNATWTVNIIGTVIDELHCVLEWKESFCTLFGLLGKTKIYLSSEPIFGASATLTPSMTMWLTDILLFMCRNSFLNVRNDHPNITTIVCWMAGGASDFKALDFLLDEAKEGKPLVRTIVFFITRNIACHTCQYVRRKLFKDLPYQHSCSCSWCGLPRAQSQNLRLYALVLRREDQYSLCYWVSFSRIVLHLSVHPSAPTQCSSCYSHWSKSSL